MTQDKVLQPIDSSSILPIIISASVAKLNVRQRHISNILKDVLKISNDVMGLSKNGDDSVVYNSDDFVWLKDLSSSTEVTVVKSLFEENEFDVYVDEVNSVLTISWEQNKECANEYCDC